VKIQRAEGRHGWTAIPNRALEDGEVTLRARGLLAYLLSRPPGWETDSETLARSAHARHEGRDAIQGALRDLEAHGYLTRRKVQGDRGRWSTVVLVHDEPVPTHDRTSLKRRPQPVDGPVDNPVEALWTTDPTDNGFSGSR
jgi:hypothetical protein